VTRRRQYALAVDESIYRHLYEREDTHWWFRGRRAVIWSLLRRADVCDRPRILDAGCGTGRNIVEFGGLGTAQGVDPSPEAVEFCRRRGLVNVTKAGLEELPFPDGSFDLILTTDVLEHIERDHVALTELRRVAAREARLLITVPAYRWLWSQHDDSHHHKRRYTARRLSHSVRTAGWIPLLETYFNTTFLLPIALMRTVARRKPVDDRRSDYELTPKPLDRLLEQPMRVEAALIARGLRMPAGVSVGMVCAPLVASVPGDANARTCPEPVGRTA
jgi:SAM-dependent methyltransferase